MMIDPSSYAIDKYLLNLLQSMTINLTNMIYQLFDKSSLFFTNII